MNWFLERLAEPSSWAGLGLVVHAVIAMATGGFSPALAAEAMGGLMAFIKKEGAR